MSRHRLGDAVKRIGRCLVEPRERYDATYYRTRGLEIRAHDQNKLFYYELHSLW